MSGGKLRLRLGRAATLLATHPSQRASLPPPGNAGQHRAPGGTREGEGATSPRRDPPSSPFLPEVAHNFKFPCLGC